MMKSNINLKTPITYYGGKQNLLAHILPRIPSHASYIEPFVGGGAVFWAKMPSKAEIINDTNKELINFYTVLKNDFVALEKEIGLTLHSRDLHRKAWTVYSNSDMFAPVQRAWAVWVLSSQSFSGLLNGSWRYDKNVNRISRAIQNKKERFTEGLAIRMQPVHIECTDAVDVLKRYDTENSFFYCDPPYFNADAGHYRGYTLQDFEKLLVALSRLKGKFLLSSYPSAILSAYTNQYGWHQFSIEQKLTVNTKWGNLKEKVEVLTANYPLD